MDSIFGGKSRTGEMLISFIIDSVYSVGAQSPIGLSCQVQGPRSLVAGLI